MNNTDKIAAINEQYESKVKEINARRDYRWKNYYDCMDDYSVCGVCEQADSMEERAAKTYRDIRIEEVKNNGVHYEVSKKYVLLNVNGDIVADTVVEGKFGPFWVTTDNVCVSVPKKLSTLSKKGFTLALIETTYECVVREVTVHNRIHNSSMKIVDTKTNILTEMPEYIPTGTSYTDYSYNTYFAA